MFTKFSDLHFCLISDYLWCPQKHGDLELTMYSLWWTCIPCIIFLVCKNDNSKPDGGIRKTCPETHARGIFGWSFFLSPDFDLWWPQKTLVLHKNISCTKLGWSTWQRWSSTYTHFEFCLQAKASHTSIHHVPPMTIKTLPQTIGSFYLLWGIHTLHGQGFNQAWLVSWTIKFFQDF